MANNFRAAGGLAVARNMVQSDVPEIYLHPGQQHVAATPTLLKMILGSCAGVFLFDPLLAIGGGTHYMLPHHGSNHPSARYGDIAIPNLVEQFRALGSNSRNLEAKVFGGGSIFEDLFGGAQKLTLLRRHLTIAGQQIVQNNINTPAAFRGEKWLAISFK